MDSMHRYARKVSSSEPAEQPKLHSPQALVRFDEIRGMGHMQCSDDSRRWDTASSEFLKVVSLG